MYFVIVIILLIFIFQIIEKSRFLKIRNSSTKTSAKIIEFRKEKIKSLRNDYTKIYYPYISINNESPLKVLASDITNKKLIILPDDLPNYEIDPMEFEISKAVVMSMSIPFYFFPFIFI